MLLKRFFLHIRTTLIAGLLAILPIGVTLFVLKFFFELLDPILGPIFDMGNVRIFPGLGVIVLLILLYVVGIITSQCRAQTYRENSSYK